MQVVVDKYTRFVLTIIAVLLTVVAVGMWSGTASMVPSAQAKLLDSGEQLEQMILELQLMNDTLMELQGFLKSGQLKVEVVDTSTDKAAPTTSPAKKSSPAGGRAIDESKP